MGQRRRDLWSSDPHVKWVSVEKGRKMTFLRQPTRAGVRDAAEKIARILPPTPLYVHQINGMQVAFKAESLQPIGAFKIRGAWHRLTALDDDMRRRGVVAFSSGNHAQGVAWAARRLGMPATIVMPADAPRAKLEGTLALGAEVVRYDRATESREGIAARRWYPASTIRGSSRGRAARGSRRRRRWRRWAWVRRCGSWCRAAAVGWLRASRWR